MNTNLLKILCDTPGLPGGEDKIRQLFITELKNYTEGVKVDTLGNVIAHIPGSGPKLVLDAHMDEVGFMVSHIESNGFLRVIPLGGIDPRVSYAQRLVVWSKKKLIGAVAAIPPHISKNSNNKEAPEVEDCMIDVGLSAEKVKQLVSVGDHITFDTELHETDDAIISKAIDDRVGLFIILEVLKKNPKLDCDLYITATVQEEPGLRGARIITPAIEPDFVLALEGTVAMDIPGIPEYKSLANIGKGPEIRLSDRYLIADRNFSFWITKIAEENKIPFQITVKKAGGTNATAMQVTGKGAKAAVISVPTRYLHSPSSIAYKKDIENTINLVKALIENLNNF